MSDLNHYAVELERAVTKAFAELTAAEKARKSAEADMREHPVKTYKFMDKRNSDELKKALDIRERFYHASDEYQRVRRRAYELDETFRRMREELAAEIEQGVPLDPKKIDQGKLQMIEKNMVGPVELENWMDEAEVSKNDTMRKILADHARKLSASIGNDQSKSRERQRLNFVVHRYYSNQPMSEKKLDEFDALIDVAKRGIQNPAMREHWGELTAEIIEDF